jgi:CheY-like chemotaxis protein
VLCDIGLPGLDGYQVARLLRQDHELKGVCLVAVSGYGQDADHRRALEEGFDGYLTKPIDFKELERFLRHGRGAGAERPRDLHRR